MSPFVLIFHLFPAICSAKWKGSREKGKSFFSFLILISPFHRSSEKSRIAALKEAKEKKDEKSKQKKEQREKEEREKEEKEASETLLKAEPVREMVEEPIPEEISLENDPLGHDSYKVCLPPPPLDGREWWPCLTYSFLFVLMFFIIPSPSPYTSRFYWFELLFCCLFYLFNLLFLS